MRLLIDDEEGVVTCKVFENSNRHQKTLLFNCDNKTRIKAKALLLALLDKMG